MGRDTIQKALVLNTVNELHNHATADEIYQKVRKEHPNISKGTVYRNLNVLDEEGKIKKRTLLGNIDRFDHITSDHYHFICQKCGKIYDLDKDSIDIENELHIDKNGFEVNDIVFSGICPDCASKDDK